MSPRLSMRCSARRLPVCSGPNPRRAVTQRVWARPSSIASTKGFTFCFLFLRLLRCFSSPGSPRNCGSAISCTGLPHSEIPGSKVICTSPELFAACHVFLRLLKPRHPPSALVHFLCNVFLFVGRHVLRRVDVALVFTNFVQSCQRSFAAVWRQCGAQRVKPGAFLRIVKITTTPKAASPHLITFRRLMTSSGALPRLRSSPKRRCSSRTFRYGYLVTT